MTMHVYAAPTLILFINNTDKRITLRYVTKAALRHMNGREVSQRAVIKKKECNITAVRTVKKNSVNILNLVAFKGKNVSYIRRCIQKFPD